MVERIIETDHNKTTRLRILIIEDDEDFAFLEQNVLYDHFDCQIKIVQTRKELKLADILHTDIVLLDFNLPDTNGAEILQLIRSKTDIPVLIITANDQLQTAIDTLKSGATDFLVKSPLNIDLLPRVVKTVLDEYQNRKLVEKKKKEQEELETKIATLRQLLTTLAHYINNSTTTIFGYAQLCSQEPDNKNRCEKLSKISIRETKKISFVLKELENLINSMEIKTTNYLDIPDAMFAIEENIRKNMERLDRE